MRVPALTPTTPTKEPRMPTKLPSFDQYSRRALSDGRITPAEARRLTGIANQHRVDIATVRQYSRERDVVFDVVVMLCFGFFYAIGAYYVCVWIMRRFTSDARGYWIMAAVLSGCVALVGVLLGNLASIVVEGVRLNSGHLSYRMARIPWREHWVMLFACGIIVFGFVAMFVYKRSHEAQII